MFISFLIFLIASLVMLAAVVLICAPFKVEIRTSQNKSIEFKFGHSMPNIWASISWFTIKEIYYDREGELEYARIIWSFWKTSKQLYINGTEHPDEDSDEDPGIVMNIYHDPYKEERIYDERMDMCPEEIEFEEKKEKAFLRAMEDRKMEEYL